MTDQKRMFGHEDLPLFSGTPVRVDPPKVASDTLHRQRPLGAECRLCFDTGIIMDGHDVKFCWCGPGRQAWEKAKRDAEA